MKSLAGECVATNSSGKTAGSNSFTFAKRGAWIGAAVMTQHHCQGQEVAEDAIGLAAYTMDSHNVQRYVDANGHVRNEGDSEVEISNAETDGHVIVDAIQLLPLK